MVRSPFPTSAPPRQHQGRSATAPSSTGKPVSRQFSVPGARRLGLALSDEDLLLAHGDEAAAERETPQALYPTILATAFRATGAKLGKKVDDEWAACLAGSVPDWPAFPDSADALARLAEHYQLIILSNVHRGGFAGSNIQLRGIASAVANAFDSN